MERIFSVDDIVGTLWHSGGDLTTGVQSGGQIGEGNGGGESEYNPQFGLNRSASEFAFQEFIKHSCVLSSRNDTQKYATSDDEAENDEDFCRVLPLRDEAENDEAPTQEEEDRARPREPKHEDSDPTTGSPSAAAPKVDDHRDSDSPSKSKTTAESSFEEPEIKAALNPLFSGLHSEMTPTSDPQEINSYYQEKLAEACFRARKAREGVLGLQEADQSGLRRTNGVTSGQFGTDALPGGLVTPARLPSKPVTSGSSQEQSDDEDCENEQNEQNLEPGNEKRVKRMLSNRESARRSRRRKQAHLNELESQVAQLRVQNSTLAESLHTTSQKLKDASKDNLQLKTYVEMLKAKLLAASALHRQLSMSRSQGQPHRPSTLGPQELPAVSHGFVWESGSHNMQDARPGHSFMMPPPRTAVAPVQMNSQHHQMEQSISETVQQGVKMSRTPSMQRVGSMDHLKKRVRNVGASCSPTSWGTTGLDLEGPSMIPQFSLSSDY